MSMNKKNRQSHQETPVIRWKPNVGENHLLQYVSIFFQLETFFTIVLVQSFTSTQAATCRELQLSLVFQFLLEGSYNPLFSFYFFRDHVSLIFKLDPWTSNSHQVHANHPISLYNQPMNHPTLQNAVNRKVIPEI